MGVGHGRAVVAPDGRRPRPSPCSPAAASRPGSPATVTSGQDASDGGRGRRLRATTCARPGIRPDPGRLVARADVRNRRRPGSVDPRTVRVRPQSSSSSANLRGGHPGARPRQLASRPRSSRRAEVPHSRAGLRLLGLGPAAPHGSTPVERGCGPGRRHLRPTDGCSSTWLLAYKPRAGESTRRRRARGWSAASGRQTHGERPAHGPAAIRCSAIRSAAEAGGTPSVTRGAQHLAWSAEIPAARSPGPLGVEAVAARRRPG